MNAFCRWLHEEGEIPTLLKFAPMRLEKRIIRTHDDAALKALLTYKPKSQTHNTRSARLNRSCRRRERWTTWSWWRRARISASKAALVRNDVRRV
jgi:hypothetical protein